MTLSEQQSVSRVEDSLDPAITLPSRRRDRAKPKKKRAPRGAWARAWVDPKRKTSQAKEGASEPNGGPIHRRPL
jgi:hypothetical protein